MVDTGVLVMLTQLLSIQTSQSSSVSDTQPRASLQSSCIIPCSQRQEVKVSEVAAGAASDNESHRMFFRLHPPWSLSFLQALCICLAVSWPHAEVWPVLQ